MIDFKAADDSEEEDDYWEEEEEEDLANKMAELKNEKINSEKREKETLGLKLGMNTGKQVALSAIKQAPQIIDDMNSGDN